MINETSLGVVKLRFPFCLFFWKFISCGSQIPGFKKKKYSNFWRRELNMFLPQSFQAEDMILNQVLSLVLTTKFKKISLSMFKALHCPPTLKQDIKN